MLIAKIFNAVKAKLSSNRKMMFKKYYRKYIKYSFKNLNCNDERQYEAVITKLYHGIEKGLAYANYKAGFGKQNIILLISLMEQYAQKYDITVFFYKTHNAVL